VPRRPGPKAHEDIAPMTLIETFLSPLQPAVATLLSPSSICSIYSLGASLMIAFAWLAYRRKRRNRRVVLKTLARAILARRILLHRSTFADLAYCTVGLATFGAIIGWAVVSTSWISDGVAAFLTRVLGPPPQPHAPEAALNATRTLALFLAYDLGFFVDHTLKHRIPALWELHKAHHSAEVLTPLVNFRVHPLGVSLIFRWRGRINGARLGLRRRRGSRNDPPSHALLLSSLPAAGKSIHPGVAKRRCSNPQGPLEIERGGHVPNSILGNEKLRPETFGKTRQELLYGDAEQSHETGPWRGKLRKYRAILWPRKSCRHACQWTASSRATIVSRVDELLAEPNARPVCALRMNSCRLGPLNKMASVAGLTGANSSELSRARGSSARASTNRARSPAPIQPFGAPHVGSVETFVAKQ
jgi:Fatty acid hydroxylase superfamily